MNLRIQTPNSPLQESDLSKIERRLNVSLPKAYRDFLTRFNGGVPYDNTFDVTPKEENRLLYTFVIQKFLGLNSRGVDDLLRTYDSLVSLLPAKLLPVAVDRFINFMCLALPEGEVFFYDHQSYLKAKIRSGKDEEHKPPPVTNYIYPVAYSFDSLLENLYHRKFN